jgi:hypothetical protein
MGNVANGGGGDVCGASANGSGRTVTSGSVSDGNAGIISGSAGCRGRSGDGICGSLGIRASVAIFSVVISLVRVVPYPSAPSP